VAVTESPRENWPASAKTLLIALVVVAALVVIPWILMSWTMAATCTSMMGAMPGMMEMMPRMTPR